MQFSITKETLKIQVKIMREFIPDLTQSSAYQLLAKLYGFDGWNQLSAALKKEI